MKYKLWDIILIQQYYNVWSSSDPQWEVWTRAEWIVLWSIKELTVLKYRVWIIWSDKNNVNLFEWYFFNSKWVDISYKIFKSMFKREWPRNIYANVLESEKDYSKIKDWPIQSSYKYIIDKKIWERDNKKFNKLLAKENTTTTTSG